MKRRDNTIYELANKIGFIKKGDTYYRLEKVTRKNGELAQAYIPVDPDIVQRELRELAKKIANSPGFDVIGALTNIIIDTLEEMPMEKIKQISKAFEDETARAKEEGKPPQIRTVQQSGGCVGLIIGEVTRTLNSKKKDAKGRLLGTMLYMRNSNGY